MKDIVPSGALVAAPDAIFDLQRVSARLDEVAGSASGRAATIEAMIGTLRDEIDTARERIAVEVRARPLEARPITRSYTYLAESILQVTIPAVITHLHPLPTPTSSEKLSVLLVGGSGRAEMAPFSDIDVLFLTPYKQTAWGESVVESALYILWDLKLKVGYSVRTVNDCLRLAKEDITIRTNLLEGRFLMGDANLAADLEQRLWDEIFSKTGREFVEAKLEERNERHTRHGLVRYVLEPNVKEGKGGLRDLQTLYWIAKYLYHAKSPHDLVGAGLFTEDEFKSFEEAETFLWSVRCLLHLSAGRAAEQLTFDQQVEIAAALGYKDKEGLRAVEQFMQTYFRHARHVGELTRIFLVALEESHAKRQPGIASMLKSAFAGSPKIPDGFALRSGRIDFDDSAPLAERPNDVLRLFQTSLTAGTLIHPDALRKVATSLDLFTDEMRNDPSAAALFLDLLLGNDNPERALRRMNEIGVLGAFIPEFDRIVALMQFNMYHVYTVDEHTIQCVSVLSKIERQELVEDLPIASSILKGGINRKVLYVALLLHDIGKGRPEDHSVIGAEIAAEVCPRLGLAPEETETVVWLVRNHLLMSDVAQKRDISDPRTVRDFAEHVRSVSNLKLLTVLTVCDIMGVGPGRWNNWKAMLLRQLFAETTEHLREGGTTQTRQARVDAAKDVLAEALAKDGVSRAAIETELQRHYPSFWVSVNEDTRETLVRLAQDAVGDAIQSDFQKDPSRDATRACFAMADHPGIFARLTGALALAGANVVDARTFTTSDGVATSVFWLQDIAGKPYENTRLGRLRKSIDRTLGGEIVAREVLREREVEKRREQPFTVPTTVTIDNEGSDIFTIIEVDTRDRQGLLHDLSRALVASNLSVNSAIIATYGKQAVDTFYVKDLFGLKVHSETKKDLIRRNIRRAIERADRFAPEHAGPTA